ncbi:MAG: hypothetical protein DMG49_01905 [Acidobacteria bacterium]|nr:MAG: hypothetical protein DMG49_01905 [Acidobacteriota bacterium]
MRLPSPTKRGHSRYPITGKFEGNELASYHTKKKPVTLRGQIKDISDGGFCLLANHAPKQSALLQGQLRLPKMPAQIPTLVQVRWIDRPSLRHYRIGLQYAI